MEAFPDIATVMHILKDTLPCTLFCSYEVEAFPDIATPKHLVPLEEIQGKVQQMQPKFVPLQGDGSDGEYCFFRDIRPMRSRCQSREQSGLP